MADELEKKFEYDTTNQIIEDQVKAILDQKVYDAKEVHTWSSQIVERVLKQLHKQNKPFKYVVTCVIMQKNGAGLHTASTCYWDTKADGSCSYDYHWNKTMHAICTVFALHI
uniref:Dynein light chain Tctex-type 1 n=1 Tax=Lotharella oceanica TaxID=641309 RepID=A0A7S2X7D1_9EUKA